MGNDVSMIKEYREKIGSELSKIYDDMLNLLDSRLIPSASSAESKVFYLKMKGDYHTYLSEFKSGEEKRKVAGSTLRAYNSAQDIALAELPPVNPLRLRLALNFSVFYYKVLKKPNLTRNLAKQAFDEATSELHTLAEESYKETAYFMQPLHDNVKLWTSQGQQ